MAVNHRVSVILVTAVTALSAVAGCTATPIQTPSPTPTASGPVTPSPTPLTPSEQGLVHAKAAVARLWATYDRIATDSKAPIKDIQAVAGSPLQDALQQNLARYRQYELTGSGNTEVTEATARLTGVDEQGRTTWLVTACLDRTHFDLVDKTGKSILGPPYRVVHDATVVLGGGEYLVTQDESTGTC